MGSIYDDYNIEKLDEFAKKVKEHSEKYGFPVIPKNSKKNSEKEDIKDWEMDGFNINEIRIIL